MSKKARVKKVKPRKPREGWVLWGAGGFGPIYHTEEGANNAAIHGCVEEVVHMKEVVK